MSYKPHVPNDTVSSGKNYNLITSHKFHSVHIVPDKTCAILALGTVDTSIYIKCGKLYPHGHIKCICII